MTNGVTQAILKNPVALNPGQSPLILELFNPNGEPFAPGESSTIEPAEKVDPITIPNGSDATTTQALANANKAKINEIITKLTEGGFLSTGIL